MELSGSGTDSSVTVCDFEPVMYVIIELFFLLIWNMREWTKSFLKFLFKRVELRGKICVKVKE